MVCIWNNYGCWCHYTMRNRLGDVNVRKCLCHRRFLVTPSNGNESQTYAVTNSRTCTKSYSFHFHYYRSIILPYIRLMDFVGFIIVAPPFVWNRFAMHDATHWYPFLHNFRKMFLCMTHGLNAAGVYTMCNRAKRWCSHSIARPIAVKSKGNADKFQANGKMSEMWCHVNVIQIE